jgi:hypothetical protein
VVGTSPNQTFQPPLNPLLHKEGKLHTTLIFEAEAAEMTEDTAIISSKFHLFSHDIHKSSRDETTGVFRPELNAEENITIRMIVDWESEGPAGNTRQRP